MAGYRSFRERFIRTFLGLSDLQNQLNVFFGHAVEVFGDLPRDLPEAIKVEDYLESRWPSRLAMLAELPDCLFIAA